MGSTRKGRDVDAALRKKGFRRDTDGKHIWYYFTDTNGKDTHIRVMMSHGMLGSSLSARLIGSMARQIRLNKTQFLELVDCTLSENEYRALLTQT